MWDAMAGSQFVSDCLLTLHSWRDQKKSEYVKSEIPSVKVIQSNVREKKPCNSVLLHHRVFLYKSWTNCAQEGFFMLQKHI